MRKAEFIKKKFPTGFFNDLHPDFSVNFQMNRCYNWANDEEMPTEMRKVSPRIHNYDDFIREFIKLYEKSMENKQNLKAAYYLRMAEFYMTATHPEKQKLRKKSISLMREYFKIKDEQYFLDGVYT
ncbi:alpha/beta hydrolase, partial [Bacillus cereus]